MTNDIGVMGESYNYWAKFIFDGFFEKAGDPWTSCLAELSISTNPKGGFRTGTLAQPRAPVVASRIEGTGPYGAGLSRSLVGARQQYLCRYVTKSATAIYAKQTDSLDAEGAGDGTAQYTNGLVRKDPISKYLCKLTPSMPCKAISAILICRSQTGREAFDLKTPCVRCIPPRSICSSRLSSLPNPALMPTVKIGHQNITPS